MINIRQLWLFVCGMILGQLAYAECDTSIKPTTLNRVFTVSADKLTVTDERTSLVWQRCPQGTAWSANLGCSMYGAAATSFTWQQALALTQNQIGWRLPNKKELASIIEFQCQMPAQNTDVFPLVSGGNEGVVYWTSTPLIYFSKPTVWAIDFAQGKFVTESATNLHWVRLVRNSME